MRKILITGKNSYIGSSFQEWVMNEPDTYQVDTLSLRDESWRKTDFSHYDVVLHVAGVAHIRETKENKNLYYRINRDLAVEVAIKAKKDGVRQFVFLSSMSVYGVNKGTINKKTPTKPNTAYGKSKLEAEVLINKLGEPSFLVAIIRPPMVYGKGCKGNYQKLSKLAVRTPVFPKIDNERSMIYIDNLSEFLRQIIDHNKEGIFYPQNADFVNTSDMVKTIAEVHGKKVRMTHVFNLIIKLTNTRSVNKVFGDLKYDKGISGMNDDYIVSHFKESICKTEELS